jgi:hypothetical protein
VQDPVSLQPKRTVEELLMRLDQDIRRFQIDFERFFTGNLPMPPEQLRIMVQNQIKELRTVHMKAVAHRFRYNGLEAKFNALLVLFNRRLREYELGRKTQRSLDAQGPSHDPIKGVIINDQPAVAAVQALFNGLYADSDRAPRADFDKFQTYLNKQVAQIRDKTGCDEVSFRVASEKGKLKLKARPIKPTPGGPD